MDYFFLIKKEYVREQLKYGRLKNGGNYYGTLRNFNLS